MIGISIIGIGGLVLGALLIGLAVGRARRPGRMVFGMALLALGGAALLWIVRGGSARFEVSRAWLTEGSAFVEEPGFLHGPPPVELTAAPDTVSVIKAKLTKSVERGKVRWRVESDPKKTTAAAIENAQQAARAFLAAQLKQIHPGADYTPGWQEIRRITQGDPRVTKQEFGEPLNETLYKAELVLELSGADYDVLLRRVRLQEAAERDWLFTKGLLGALALLGAVAGYFRLDERTKGYYTGWLRVGVVAFLTAAGVGISLLP